MKKLNLNLALGVSSLFIIAGCAKMDTSGVSPKDRKDNKDVKSDTTVCYQATGKCYKTIAASALIDPNKDYTYPNPNTFPRKEQRKQYSAPLYFFDLKTINPDDKLALNFKIGDFLSASKGQYGVYSPLVVEKLQAIRSELRLPVIITSGYRSPGYNRRTDGSAKWSRHTYGDAADFQVNGKTPDQLSQNCINQNASFYLVYKTHIHCDWRNEQLEPGFYGTPQKIRQQNEDFSTLEMNLAKAESESRFHFTEDENFRYLTVAVPHDEDEGDLIYEWYVTMPDGQIIHSEDAVVTLPKVNGTFHISALIGGALHFEENLVW